MINIEEFNPGLLKIDKYINICYIGYITKKNDDYENVYSVSFLYFIVGKVHGHTEEKNGNKYLVFGSTDKNKKVLKKYT